MEVLGVTIGCGYPFDRMATLAAGEWTRRTGCRAHVLGQLAQGELGISTPHRLKFELFRLFRQAEALAFFDADIVFLQDFCPAELLGDDGFAAVRDLGREPWIVADAARAGVRPQHYFNSGFFLLHRRHAAVLELARSLADRVPTPFRDQTHLNAAADLLQVGVNYLPARFNSHVDRQHTKSLDGVVGAHMHWLKDEPPVGIERFYSDEARELFWRA